MLANETVQARSVNTTDLAILEALMMKQHCPIINKQMKDFSRTLKIYFNLST